MPNILLTVIGIAISLPISIALIMWMLHYKKNRRFPKGSVWLMLLFGALACVPPIIIGIIVDAVGGGIANMLKGADAAAEAGQKLPANLMLASSAINAFIMAALIEEILKFVGVTLAAKRRGTIENRFDAVLCGAIVGIGFQLLEDALYVDPSGSLFTTLIRTLTPFHFTFGALMGLFYGEARATGKKGFYVLAILVPFAAHGLYDFAQDLINISDLTFVLFFVSILAMLALTIVMMVKIHKWSKSEKMLAPLNLYQ